MLGNGKEYRINACDSCLSKLVRDKLEGRRRGSRYPYFQKLSMRGEIIYWKEMEKFREELLEISDNLTNVPYPVATYFKGNLELGYSNANYEGHGISYSRTNERECYGVDDEGLFKGQGKPPFYMETISKEHFKEVEKGNPEFKNFRFLCGIGDVKDFDRIVHQHKGSTLVWKYSLDWKIGLAANAIENKKDLIIR